MHNREFVQNEIKRLQEELSQVAKDYPNNYDVILKKSQELDKFIVIEMQERLKAHNIE